MNTTRVYVAAACFIVASLAAAHLYAQAVAADAIKTGRWTPAEAAYYKDCLGKLYSQSRDTALCEVSAEGQHWKNLHPEVKGRKENSAVFTKCNHDHAAQMNGTPQQFYAALDLCLRRAYGLPAPK